MRNQEIDDEIVKLLSERPRTRFNLFRMLNPGIRRIRFERDGKTMSKWTPTRVDMRRLTDRLKALERSGVITSFEQDKIVLSGSSRYVVRERYYTLKKGVEGVGFNLEAGSRKLPPVILRQPNGSEEAWLRFIRKLRDPVYGT